jgi:hypothetical protein
MEYNGPSFYLRNRRKIAAWHGEVCVTELTENTAAKKDSSSKKNGIKRTLLIGGAFILGFVILGVIAIQVWEYSNSVEFCANACHDVHPEEVEAFRDSYHANVKCTECHMGRLGTLPSILLKATHFRHLPEVLFDQYERPLQSETMRPARESCELCHWPPAFHGDTVQEITHFAPDEKNTEERIYLILKTGAGTREKGLGYGIHWHITNPVEYIATDEQKQEIRWVRTTLPDGRTLEYNDVTAPLSAEEIAAAEKKTMDCVDCHNRVGHPFASPDDLVDQAMAEGLLSQDLPYAKKEMSDLLTTTYASQEEALAMAGDVRARYEAEYPEVAASHPEEIEQAEELAQALLGRLVFDEPGVTWESFPDNNKHKDFAGCFRCHDGKHLSSDGESIRLHCNICHSIPVTVRGNERPPQMPLAYVQEPASHLETNFMADHRFQANDECVQCHGEVEFGDDDSSFCANSACHGRSWPLVELDAAFPHPIALEGKHAEVWCHECHEGVKKPEYVCANCHEPPMEPHFGEACEDCHTPAGFEFADLGDFEHPIALVGAHATLTCSDCHTAGEELTYECAACHQPPSETHFGPNCEDCHTPEGFEGAEIPPELHPVPLVGAHLRATCDVCHAEGQQVPEYVCSNCHRPPEDHFPAECSTCHTPEGWVESASSMVGSAPEIEHELEGREDCLLCHDPAGNVKPAPSSHTDYINEQCTLCHKVED